MDVAISIKAVESLLMQGSGAIKLARWIVAAAAVLGAGFLGHNRAAEFLQWFARSSAELPH